MVKLPDVRWIFAWVIFFCKISRENYTHAKISLFTCISGRPRCIYFEGYFCKRSWHTRMCLSLWNFSYIILFYTPELGSEKWRPSRSDISNILQYWDCVRRLLTRLYLGIKWTHLTRGQHWFVQLCPVAGATFGREYKRVAQDSRTSLSERDYIFMPVRGHRLFVVHRSTPWTKTAT